jgi:hypothetical protein
VSITGLAQVGRQLAAQVGASTPPDVTLSYQWRRDGSSITGATSRVRTLTAADLGHRLTVRVTGRKTGWTSATRTSAATAVVAPGQFTLAPIPTITGRARVGSTLTAVIGTWSPSASFAITWFAESSVITGQRGLQLKLTSSQLGKRIRVRVVALRPGYLPVARTSSFTTRVTR